MYLLILKSSIRPFVTCFPFTFHNVSINSICKPGRESNNGHLHSIMYLLIRKTGDTVNAKDLFTFHNVSINSPVAAYSLPLLLHLHSIMYLLIRVMVADLIFQSSSFTFHNVSINSAAISSSIKVIKRFTFHNVSINSKGIFSMDMYFTIYIP